MSAVVRTWLGFAALGAGLIHLALAVDAPLPLGIVLVLLGIVEFAWGVMAFTTDATPYPRVARVATMIPVIVWALALVSGLAFTGAVRVFPMLAASALDLGIAVGITMVLRRAAATAARGADAPPSRTLTAPVYLAAMFAGALLVGAIATPALAATQAGDFVGPGDGTLPGIHGH